MTNDERRTTNDEAEVSSIVHRPSSLVTELKSFLAARLPEYMVPSAFVLLDALPLTLNRKVDHKALPAPDSEQRAPEHAFEPPRTPLERDLAAIWSELLGVEQVGRNDNFFALGGHSLLATRVVARLRQQLQAELPLRMLFELPTVAGLAGRIEALQLAARHLQTTEDASIDDDEEEGEL